MTIPMKVIYNKLNSFENIRIFVKTIDMEATGIVINN